MLRFLALLPLLTLASACPLPDPPLPPGPPTPLELSARVADDAVVPDAGDAPATALLPEALPESALLVDLGLVAIVDGVSAPISVDVAGFSSFMVLVWGHEGATVILESALDPDGAAVVSAVEPEGVTDDQLAFARGFPAQVFSLNRVLGSDESGAFTVPNTPSIEARDGTWTVRVGQFLVDREAQPPSATPVDRPVRVIIVARRADTSSRGTLDLNLHFTGGAMSAASAPDDESLQQALDTLRDAYGAVGIGIGEVRYRDVDPTLATVELIEGRCEGGELHDLAREGAGALPGVDIFFVDGFVCFLAGGVDVGPAIAGISAGLPGPAFVHGSAHSGVAVSTSFASEDAERFGVVIAHELAHFLGLYHTREANLFGDDAVFDEIEDTPEGNDADDNLMYFAAEDNIRLTAGQGRVLRSSPFVIPEE